jgi:excisionase family DNA binding protein
MKSKEVSALPPEVRAINAPAGVDLIALLFGLRAGLAYGALQKKQPGAPSMPAQSSPAAPTLALSPAAAAHSLGVSKRTLSRLVASGKIVARKIGSRTVIEWAILQSYLGSAPRVGAVTVLKRKRGARRS